MGAACRVHRQRVAGRGGRGRPKPSTKRRCKDRPPPGPLLIDDQVRKLAEAKELKDKELIDEDEYKQMKAVILGKTIIG